MFGLQTPGNHRSQLALAKKHTMFMPNSHALGKEWGRGFDKSHDHHHFVDGRAKDAVMYPPELCRALCKGILKRI